MKTIPALLVLIFLGASCSQPEPHPLVSGNLKTSVRTVLPAVTGPVDLTAPQYTLTLTRSGYTPLTQTNTTGAFSLANIEVGTWSAELLVLDTAGTMVLGRDTQSVTILAGQVASPVFAPVPPDGAGGTVDFLLSWPAPLSPMLTLTKLASAGGTDLAFTAEVLNGSPTTLTNIKPGLYRATFSLKSGAATAWGLTETILVLDQKTTGLGTVTVTGADLFLPPQAANLPTPQWIRVNGQWALQVLWTIPAATAGTTIPTELRLERSPDGGLSWVPLVAGLDPLSGNYIDTDSVDPQVSYSYRVVTESPSATSPVLQEASVDTGSSGTAPSSTAQVDVSEPGTLTIGLSGLLPVYSGGRATVTASVTGGPGPFLYAWSVDGAPVASSGSSIVLTSALPLGSHTVSVLVTGNGTAGSRSALFYRQNPLTLSGTVSTLAGTPGTSGLSDGSGAATLFNHPWGVAADGPMVYVSDSGSHVIRSYNSDTGEVAIVAGRPGEPGAVDGSATAATFSAPEGLAFDHGILYVADTGNQTIRRIDLAAGQVATLAGLAGSPGLVNGTGSSARFNGPQGVAVDGRSLYVSDSLNNRIRKIDLPTAAVTIFAGGSATGGQDGIGASANFSGPRGLAAGSGWLYVADQNARTIRKINLSTASVVTLAGTYNSRAVVDGSGAVARFYTPCELALDGTDLYVTDGDQFILRKVNAAGTVTTVAGVSGSSGSTDAVGPSARFSGPFGIAVAARKVFVAENTAHTLREYDLTTQAVTTVAGTSAVPGTGNTVARGTPGKFNSPFDVVTDGKFLYVADFTNSVIRKVDPATGQTTVLAGGTAGTADGVGTAAQFDGPAALACDGAHLFVADYNKHTIRQIDLATAAVSTLAGSPGLYGATNGTGSAARFFWPQGLCTDGTSLYVTESGSPTVRKIDIASRVVSLLAGGGGASQAHDGIGAGATFLNPFGLTTDGRNVYVVDGAGYNVRQIEVSTGTVTTLAGSPCDGVPTAGSLDGTGTAARFNAPRYVASDGASLYVSDFGGQQIRRIDMGSRAVTTVAGKPSTWAFRDGSATAAQFYSPLGLAVLGRSLYVADKDNHVIRRIQ